MKLLVILMLLLPTISFSQEEALSDSLIMDNTFGISFSFSSLDLGKFEGGIGGKYWFSNDYAMYLSIDFWLQKGEYYRNEIERSSGGISLGGEKHFFVREIISPFVGIGFRYSGNSEDVKSKDLDDQSNIERYENSQGYTISTGIFFGVEIFVVDFISLSANYGIWLTHSKSEHVTYFNNGTDDYDETKFTTINSSVSDLTISVYF